VPNLVTAMVGADVKVKVCKKSGSTHVIFDVVGWCGATGDQFHPVTPTRILDTRYAPPVPAMGKMAANADITAAVTSLGGIRPPLPAS